MHIGFIKLQQGAISRCELSSPPVAVCPAREFQLVPHQDPEKLVIEHERMESDFGSMVTDPAQRLLLGECRQAAGLGAWPKKQDSRALNF